MNSTVDKREMQLYKKASSIWWNKNGSFFGLHCMNQIRIPRIQDGLIKTGAIKKELIGTSKPLKDLVILDVGCGGGFLSEELARLGSIVTGIDACQEQIEVAKKHATFDSSLSNLEYRCETSEEHALNNYEKYDAIVASEVLDHVSDSKLFLESCVKCLKPGGSIFVTTINKTMIAWLVIIVYLEYITGYLPQGTHLYEKFISPEDTQKMLESCNCSVISLVGSLYNVFTKNWSDTSSTSVFYAVHAVKK